MQWLYLISQGTVPTRVYFRCAALQQSARGYNARTYSQSKTDVSVQTVYKFIFFNYTIGSTFTEVHLFVLLRSCY